MGVAHGSEVPSFLYFNQPFSAYTAKHTVIMNFQAQMWDCEEFYTWDQIPGTCLHSSWIFGILDGKNRAAVAESIPNLSRVKSGSLLWWEKPRTDVSRVWLCHKPAAWLWTATVPLWGSVSSVINWVQRQLILTEFLWTQQLHGIVTFIILILWVTKLRKLFLLQESHRGDPP